MLSKHYRLLSRDKTMAHDEWTDSSSGQSSLCCFATRADLEAHLASIQGEGWRIINSTTSPLTAGKMKDPSAEFWLFRHD